jgi:hypothetical protein
VAPGGSTNPLPQQVEHFIGPSTGRSLCESRRF